MAKKPEPTIFVFGILIEEKKLLLFKRIDPAGDESWFFPGTKVADKDEVYEKLTKSYKDLTGLDIQVTQQIAAEDDQLFYSVMRIGGKLDSSVRATDIGPEETAEDQLQLVDLKTALEYRLPEAVKEYLRRLLEQEVMYFGVTNFRNKERRFGIKTDDRRKHVYIIGKTGMGKSTLQENMIISDIRAGYGVAVVDPHGDLVEKVINFIPPERINDTVYFNPADTDNPIAFNILENVEPQYKNLIASGLVGVFKKIWADSWGPRLEYILMNTILALLEYPGSTLLGITRMLVDKAYRRKVVSRLTDPIVKAFWVDEYANYNERFRSEAISPIQNKVGQFLSSSIIRNIVGQPKSTIDMRKIMDEKKILLMNLAKGKMGEENSALMGAMMITKLQLAAMSRADIPEEERKDFYLYVDEFQNFATQSFANILSEARKYRLSLIVAHQYIEQLGEEVRAAVFGNVGTMVIFRIGAEDAEFVEQEFIPYFEQTDLVNLPKFNFYIKLMIDGVTSNPFSGRGLPPATGETNIRDRVVKVSRERYSRPRETVEEKILRWSGVETVHQEIAREDNVTQEEERPRPRRESKPKPSSPGNNPPRERKGQVVEIVSEPPPPISLNEALAKGPSSFKASRRQQTDRGRRDISRTRRSGPDNRRNNHNPRKGGQNQVIPPGKTVRLGS